MVKETLGKITQKDIGYAIQVQREHTPLRCMSLAQAILLHVQASKRWLMDVIKRFYANLLRDGEGVWGTTMQITDRV